MTVGEPVQADLPFNPTEGQQQLIDHIVGIISKRMAEEKEQKQQTEREEKLQRVQPPKKLRKLGTQAVRENNAKQKELDDSIDSAKVVVGGRTEEVPVAGTDRCKGRKRKRNASAASNAGARGSDASKPRCEPQPNTGSSSSSSSSSPPDAKLSEEQVRAAVAKRSGLGLGVIWVARQLSWRAYWYEKNSKQMQAYFPIRRYITDKVDTEEACAVALRAAVACRRHAVEQIRLGRVATEEKKEKMQSGHPGVWWNPTRRSWEVSLSVDNATVHGKSFAPIAGKPDGIECARLQAIAARHELEKRYRPSSTTPSRTAAI
eukprot:NODE_11804_length_1264_cov_4.250660.p2 GENE.NODE_11804_length_1264_cov_4.250660~~NODE_11804_length_1264_cov_4.250660.p2  ORF type:complete len:318 (+),score=76.42 NODE_11804_length_1264_cov_4.250660:62-1015(+)